MARCRKYINFKRYRFENKLPTQRHILINWIFLFVLYGNKTTAVYTTRPDTYYYVVLPQRCTNTNHNVKAILFKAYLINMTYLSAKLFADLDRCISIIKYIAVAFLY